MFSGFPGAGKTTPYRDHSRLEDGDQAEWAVSYHGTGLRRGVTMAE